MSFLFSLRTSNFFRVSILSGLLVVFSGCEQLKEQCKIYKNYSDRSACSSFCDRQYGATKNLSLIDACQLGQMGVLEKGPESAEILRIECERFYNKDSDQQLAIACKMGVVTEEARMIQAFGKPGKAMDRGGRDNGNAK